MMFERVTVRGTDIPGLELPLCSLAGHYFTILC